MELVIDRLHTLHPCQVIVFPTPNIINRFYLNAETLRIAILDSPAANPNYPSPRIAAMIVPENLERDWNFITESGHLQLLYHHNLSRLILIGNNVNLNAQQPLLVPYTRPPAMNPADKEAIERRLRGLVLRCHPAVCVRCGMPPLLFLTYDDHVVYRVIIDRFLGSSVGEFVVEDVELDSKEFRRRLRFKRMPNLIQTQIRRLDYRVDLKDLRKMKEAEFLIDTSVLVEPYLIAMVSALFLIVSPLYERMKQGIHPRALCLVVGGGSLLSFLHTELFFEVAGVEVDAVVLSAARKYFGLKRWRYIELTVGDAIELIQKVAHDSSDINIGGLNTKFDVVMVDLDSYVTISRVTAPPQRFVYKSVIQAMRLRLHDHGLLVIHVIPPNKLFYETLVQMLKEVFRKVYEIDVKNDQDLVLIATMTPTASNDHAKAFLKWLTSVISGSYMDSIQEL